MGTHRSSGGRGGGRPQPPGQPPAPSSEQQRPRPHPGGDPWPALAALCLGFFMILLDSTITSVATPAIIADLDAGVTTVVWVTSAYLLAFAVPVLVTGRLGDRFGQKRLYLVGLAMFTAASLWCGLTGSVEELIAARVVQGLGAAVMSPQTMAIVTRIFPPERRGLAMSLWGTTAGAATLAGPVLGGVLVSGLGWEWIFFVNVPVGVVGLVLAWRLVPSLATHPHRFDGLGVLLGGLAMFALVFGIQEGHHYQWGPVLGPVTVWRLIGVGLLLLALFVWWQRRAAGDALMPLSLFADRNFSLANVAVTTMGFSITALLFPLMLYAQMARGLSASAAALLLVPMAGASIVLAVWVGRLTDRVHPRVLTGAGFGCVVVSLLWLAAVMTPDAAAWALLLPMTLLGVGNALVWAPTSATANRNLPAHRAGAGAGVYNTNRQVGAVLGAAAIAALMDARLAAQGLVLDTGAAAPGMLSAQAAAAFSTAMSQAMLLPALVPLAGLAAVLFFDRPRHQRG